MWVLFSDDLHIYLIMEKKSLLNIHVLKFDLTFLDVTFREYPRLIHRTPLVYPYHLLEHLKNCYEHFLKEFYVELCI